MHARAQRPAPCMLMGLRGAAVKKAGNRPTTGRPHGLRSRKGAKGRKIKDSGEAIMGRFRAVVLCAGALVAAAGAARAQDYPNRPITLVLPPGAGGAMDIIAGGS